MSDEDALRAAWRKKKLGQSLSQEDREAINAHRRARVTSSIYFESEGEKARLMERARESGYKNFSRWLGDMVAQGFESDGIDRATVEDLEADLGDWRSRHDRLNEMYVEAASANLRLQEDNRRLSHHLSRLLDALLEDESEATA